ncbi:MAG: cation transporter [Clostridia bacterium]|nr:cation transporter [Clostridia bacterium]
MIQFLIKRFVPNYEMTEDRDVREKYGVLAGGLGIFCNLFLFVLKLIIGVLMNSIAVLSDAINNLSDMCSSLITVMGSKMSNMRADREHPFGHGRVEYVASLIVSLIIIMVGFQLFTTSIDKIFHPEPLQFQMTLFVILTASILVKFWMFSYNRYMGKKINSSMLKAAATDSLNDCMATTAVVVSVLLSKWISFPLDGFMGLIVSGLILYSGIKVAKEICGVLIGTTPSEEMIEKIEQLVLSGEGIVGVHDFMGHDYGPGVMIASIHAEVPDDVDIVKVHEVIDEIEKRAGEELGVTLVIHMDPVSLNCEKTNAAKGLVTRVITEINPKFTIHDFRMVDGEKNINLVFDLALPVSMTAEERKRVLELIRAKVRETDERYCLVIQVDNAY